MKIAAVLLTILGLAQMAGDLTRLAPLKGLAAATAASPAPRVFSSVRGLETYSTRFFIEWTEESGNLGSAELTPALYSRLRGPYNRRNAYGAVVAFGPVLATTDATRAMFLQVARYGLCGEAPVLRELGIPVEKIAGAARIRLQPASGTLPDSLPALLEAPCD
jgi:hypothetical protein